MFCRETQNTAHSVQKLKNTHFEAKMFRKTTVRGRKEHYVSLCRVSPCGGSRIAHPPLRGHSWTKSQERKKFGRPSFSRNLTRRRRCPTFSFSAGFLLISFYFPSTAPTCQGSTGLVSPPPFSSLSDDFDGPL